MFCRNCGNELDDEAVMCPKCHCLTQEIEKKSQKNLVTAANIFIIINMVLCCWAIFPLVVGFFALNKLNTARTRDELILMAVLTLFFSSMIAGIIMLTMRDEDLN